MLFVGNRISSFRHHRRHHRHHHLQRHRLYGNAIIGGARHGFVRRVCKPINDRIAKEKHIASNSSWQHHHNNYHHHYNHPVPCVNDQSRSLPKTKPYSHRYSQNCKNMKKTSILMATTMTMMITTKTRNQNKFLVATRRVLSSFHPYRNGWRITPRVPINAYTAPTAPWDVRGRDTVAR